MDDQIVEHVSQQQELLEAAQFAEVGAVGIFWFYGGKLIQESVPHTQGEDYGDFVNGRNGHCDYWRCVKSRMVSLRNYEYYEVPRGRVVFSTRDGKFYVYGSEHFVKNEDEKGMV
mgnify:FL=1